MATDIAARGIDVDELAHVINYELPNIPETYVHRIGRTGRAGLSGTALSFCDAEEKDFLKDIEKLIALKIPVTEDHPYAMSWQSLMSAVVEKPKGQGGNSRGQGGNSRGQGSRGNGKPAGGGQGGGQREPNLSGAKRTPSSGSRRWSSKK